MIDSTMERGKLSSCIAYCIRRARNIESETAILYLSKALYSLAKDEEIPRKPILCLYDALQMHDEPPQHTHFVDGRGPKAPTVETAIQKREIWTQTSGKVISELECKMLAQDIAQQMVAQAVAPLQAVVDQIQDQLHPPTALQSAPIAITDSFHADRLKPTLRYSFGSNQCARHCTDLWVPNPYMLYDASWQQCHPFSGRAEGSASTC